MVICTHIESGWTISFGSCVMSSVFSLVSFYLMRFTQRENESDVGSAWRRSATLNHWTWLLFILIGCSLIIVIFLFPSLFLSNGSAMFRERFQCSEWVRQLKVSCFNKWSKSVDCFVIRNLHISIGDDEKVLIYSIALHISFDEKPQKSANSLNDHRRVTWKSNFRRAIVQIQWFSFL